MKKILTTIIFCFLITTCFSQAGMWTWVHGDSIPDQPGNFGIQGVPSQSNNPPALYEPCEWTDLNGNFWLYGGTDTSNNFYAALWKYDPAINIWTWMKGDSLPNAPGNYGVMGVADTSNLPPARALGICSWVDLNGDLWMYGGRASGFNFDYSDLWKYNIAANTWIWMNGASPLNTSPVYGTKSVPSVLNTPGSRAECSATWVDAAGDLWLFGGIRIITLSRYNDLWKFHIPTGAWTWMKGSSTQGSLGYSAGLGIADSSNSPGARISYCSWKDSNGAFWLFGGARDPFGIHFYNDVWTYDPVTNNWIWMDGPWGFDDIGVYGQLCDSSSNYIPRSRYENRARWTDGCGRLIFYGGSTDSMTVLTERYNDMWYYNSLTLQWSIINGSAPFNIYPFYGIINVPGINNTPGGRRGAVSWKSNTGELFLFGGHMVDSIGYSAIGNDLWKFTIDPACTHICPTGIIQNNSPNQLLISPNPFTDELTVRSQKFGEIKIHDIYGRLVYEQKLQARNCKLQTANWANGIYFVEVITEEGRVV